MLSRNRLYYAALGGLVVLVLLRGAQAEQNAGVPKEAPSVEARQQGQAGNSQHRTLPFPVPIRIIEDPEESKRAGNREQRAEEHDQADLKAQELAAQAAKRAADAGEGQEKAAWAQFVLAIAGTIGLIGALGLTIRSNSIARAQLQALVRAERPLIVVHISRKATSFWEGKGRVVNLIFENHGKTPAVLTEVYIAPTVTDAGMPQPITGGDARDLPNGMIVGSGRRKPWPYEMDLMTFSDAMGGQASVRESNPFEDGPRLYISGFVRYQDLFENRHVRGFCLMWDGDNFTLKGGPEHNYDRAEKT